MSAADHPRPATRLRLLADIGGTNARFGLQARPGDASSGDGSGGAIEAVDVLACADYATVSDAIDAYLARAAARGHAVDAIADAAIAIANPVEDDLVRMTNHHWSFSIARLRAERGFDTLLVVNDFAALAMALPFLGAGQRLQIGDGDSVAVAGKPIGLIGPGTGLGVSAVLPCGAHWVPLAGEGGHASFAPGSEDEMRILQALQQDFGHVSAERLLSGMGLELMHRVLAGERLAAADITGAALAGSSAACLRTVQCFCAVLGSVAGNVALTLGATGGMYVGGGIVPRLGALFAQSAFRQRFEDKGRLSGYLARIPTYLITGQYPALVGVAAMLAAHLDDQASARSSGTARGAVQASASATA